MGSPLTPTFLFDVESRMKIVSSQEYDRLNANTYWRRLAREAPSTGRKERLLWLLDTARIEYKTRLGGNVEFEELVALTTEYEAKAATGGFELNRFQLEDHDGGGVELAAAWARQIGAYAAYWPQKQVSTAVRNGGTGLTYDGLSFFNTAHPLNPFDTAAGVFANDFTGAPSGAYPGALPIHETVTLDVAFANLQKAIAYISQIKQPSGEDPRNIKVRAMMVPSALVPRAQQLTNAKFIASAAATGGGSADVESIVTNWGFEKPIEAVELGAGFTGGSDTSWYLLAEQIGSDQLGAFTYVNREPFQVVYNTGMTDAQLQRANTLQWLTRGRNIVGYGHPFLLFRMRAA
jgi:phage major head subunit gpT-like protein